MQVQTVNLLEYVMFGRQYWFCERCRVGGVVEYTIGDWVGGVPPAAEKHHEELSPHCMGGYAQGTIRFDTTVAAA